VCVSGAVGAIGAGGAEVGAVPTAPVDGTTGLRHYMARSEWIRKKLKFANMDMQK